VRTFKVRLYIRVHLPDGRHSFLEPAWNRNHTLRAGYALVGGRSEHYPGATYYLRFLRGDKRVWKRVGRDPDRALAALRNTEHDLHGAALGRGIQNGSQSVKSPEPEPLPKSEASLKILPRETPLDEAIAAYMSEVRRFRSPKTIAACDHILTLFGSRYPKKSIQAITREDLLGHMSELQNCGLGQRTIHNHLARIGTLLRANKITGLLAHSDKPKYDEKAPSAYDADQLKALFDVADSEEHLLFEFFLGTGFREQEVMHCTWRNVDFKDKVITVMSKPEFGFRVKDKEERSVPVLDSLIEALTRRKCESKSLLVFPGPNGKPNGHFLRILQQLAFRAGLNCQECIRKSKKSKTGKMKASRPCATHPICGEWGLHKFRKTFATFLSEAGVSARTIQTWLGHSDLATTLRYLAVADLRSARTRSQVNGSFAALFTGGSAQA
jgi:integrase/recombinase XerD